MHRERPTSKGGMGNCRELFIERGVSWSLVAGAERTAHLMPLPKRDEARVPRGYEDTDASRSYTRLEKVTGNTQHTHSLFPFHSHPHFISLQLQLLSENGTVLMYLTQHSIR